MATARTDNEQLTLGSLHVLTLVVFDNIEVGLYYYVREREPGETFYDMYGRVTNKNADSVTLEIIARRGVNNENINANNWVAEDDNTYIATRELINSCEHEMSSHYYLPVDDAAAVAP
jgi:hypothetical protein